MKKFLYFALMCIFLASCNKDEPTPPILEPTEPEEPVQEISFPSQDEWNRCALNKTWALKSVDYRDSDNHIYEWPQIYGYVFSDEGFLFSSDGEVRLAVARFMNSPYYTITNFEYDPETGNIYFGYYEINKHPSLFNTTLVESISDDELIIRTEFGILPSGYWEDENGWAHHTDSGQDEGSYARAIYTPVPEDKVQDFWAKYLER